MKILLIILSLITIINSSFATSKKEITFGLFPYKSPKTMHQIFYPLTKIIERNIGRKIKIIIPSSKKKFNKDLLNHVFDMAWTCSACMFEDSIQKSYTIFAKGSPDFQGGVIVRKDSSISDPLNLKGKKIAAIGIHSYAGYRYFKEYLRKHNIIEDKNITFDFIGKLDNVIMLVIQKTYPAGVIRLDALNRSIFRPYKNKLRIIHRSEDILQFPFMIKKNMDKKITKQIIQTIININPKKNKSVSTLFKLLKINRITKASYQDYQELKKKWQKYMNKEGKQ